MQYMDLHHTRGQNLIINNSHWCDLDDISVFLRRSCTQLASGSISVSPPMPGASVGAIFRPPEAAWLLFIFLGLSG